MRPDLAQQTFQVLLHGLELRDRVRDGKFPPLGPEQAKFKSLLGPPNAAAPWGTSAHDPQQSVPMDRGSVGGDFLGIRYVLTCWLDELFSGDWTAWDESKLEMALYKQNSRAHNFWQQDRLADAIPEAADAKEAFLLCVLLGFRGDKADDPDGLKEWVTAAKGAVTRRMGKEPPAPPEQPPVTDVPPLLGVRGYRRMTHWLLLALLFALPSTVFLLVFLMKGK